MGSVKKVLAVVQHEKDVKVEIEKLTAQGFEESELNIIAQGMDRFEHLEENLDVNTVEAGSFKDQFKSFITGESSVREGLKTLDLSEAELEEHTINVARGGILIYVDIEV